MSLTCVRCREPMPEDPRLRHVCATPPPTDADAFGPLDYVANMIYQHEAQVAGEPVARWWRLPDGDKALLRQKAVELVSAWATPEVQEAAIAGRMTIGKSLIGAAPREEDE